jgi:hypothetical protein
VAWPNSLSAGPDSPALSCPPNRGHSNDATRLAYVEVLEDEKALTAAGFLRRAVAHYAAYGIRVDRVMTDNGPPSPAGSTSTIAADPMAASATSRH